MFPAKPLSAGRERALCKLEMAASQLPREFPGKAPPSTLEQLEKCDKNLRMDSK